MNSEPRESSYRRNDVDQRVAISSTTVNAAAPPLSRMDEKIVPDSAKTVRSRRREERPGGLTPEPSKKQKKTATKKTPEWGKPKAKPKRPLSAYNLFFKHERAKIVSNVSDSSDESDTREDLLNTMVANRGGLTKSDASRKMHGRRKKLPHGKIGFSELACTISKKWKELDDSSRAVFDALALVEKKRYERDIELWNMERVAEAERQIALHKQGGEWNKQQQDPAENSLACSRTQSARTLRDDYCKKNPAAMVASIPNVGNTDGMPAEKGYHLAHEHHPKTPPCNYFFDALTLKAYGTESTMDDSTLSGINGSNHSLSHLWQGRNLDAIERSYHSDTDCLQSSGNMPFQQTRHHSFEPTVIEEMARNSGVQTDSSIYIVPDSGLNIDLDRESVDFLLSVFQVDTGVEGQEGGKEC